MLKKVVKVFAIWTFATKRWIRWHMNATLSWTEYCCTNWVPFEGKLKADLFVSRLLQWQEFDALSLRSRHSLVSKIYFDLQDVNPERRHWKFHVACSMGRLHCCEQLKSVVRSVCKEKFWIIFYFGCNVSLLSGRGAPFKGLVNALKGFYCLRSTVWWQCSAKAANSLRSHGTNS